MWWITISRDKTRKQERSKICETLLRGFWEMKQQFERWRDQSN